MDETTTPENTPEFEGVSFGVGVAVGAVAITAAFATVTLVKLGCDLTVFGVKSLYCMALKKN